MKRTPIRSCSLLSSDCFSNACDVFSSILLRPVSDIWSVFLLCTELQICKGESNRSDQPVILTTLFKTKTKINRTAANCLKATSESKSKQTNPVELYILSVELRALKLKATLMFISKIFEHNRLTTGKLLSNNLRAVGFVSS